MERNDNEVSNPTNPNELCESQQILDKQAVQMNSNYAYLSPFRPLKNSSIYILNRFTKLDNIASIIECSKSAKVFSIYSERHVQTKQVIFITIEMFSIEHIKSTIINFDLLNTATDALPIFFLFKFLLLMIFQSTNRCFIWDDEQQTNLHALVYNKYISQAALTSATIIQLQGPFKKWYNKTFQHNDNCMVPTNYIEDSILCRCPHRPYKRLSDKWDLARALFYAFDEFLYTVNATSIQLSRDIQFSAICCMVLSKFSLAIELNWSKEQISQFKKLHQCKLKIVLISF